jgi:hypothetical protein
MVSALTTFVDGGADKPTWHLREQDNYYPKGFD